jgi:hypothetical protein
MHAKLGPRRVGRGHKVCSPIIARSAPRAYGIVWDRLAWVASLQQLGGSVTRLSAVGP